MAVVRLYGGYRGEVLVFETDRAIAAKSPVLLGPSSQVIPTSAGGPSDGFTLTATGAAGESAAVQMRGPVQVSVSGLGTLSSGAVITPDGAGGVVGASVTGEIVIGKALEDISAPGTGWVYYFGGRSYEVP